MARIDLPILFDEAVDKWHESSRYSKLYEVLGLTRTEYAQWLIDPDAVYAMLLRDQKRISIIQEYINGTY